MLRAAKDKYGGDIDVNERLDENRIEEKVSGKIAASFGVSMFHSVGLIEDDRQPDEDLCVDFEDDLLQDIYT